MHTFLWFPTNAEAPAPELRGAYLIGADGVPARGELRIEGGAIVCETRYTDAIGLSLLWPVKNSGLVQLETTRLPARETPYHLHIELARHRLLRISTKMEEWGLFDYPGMEELSQQIDMAREVFIGALQKVDDPLAAAKLADQALAMAIDASDRMCQFHAGVFLARRQQAGGFARHFLGVQLLPGATTSAHLSRAVEGFDFVRVPFVWRDIQPTEHGVQYEKLDTLIKASVKAGLSIRGGPLLNFGVRFVPDWMYIWENDYEAIAEFAREQIRRTVMRYATHTPSWIVAGGLHAENVFSFNLEQIMDLTRMAASVTKQIATRAQVILELTQPWGEYYARNQRSAPPLLYAEMAVQSGVPFDAFGLQFLFGLDSDGFHRRDLLQISSLIDRIANLGKPMHVTAVGVPSKTGGNGVSGGCWSDQIQADWLASFMDVVLSRPFVESVCLESLADSANNLIPNDGVLRETLQPKPAFERLATVRAKLRGAKR